ncbi:MAG: beta-glucanase precursor [Candidatus Omnitrophica bacterium]|nr:beta-glucanase precursor [Candidatus Omnitrophota bacterium]
MKKAMPCCLFVLSLSLLFQSPAAAVNYGDFKSSTLTAKAWGEWNTRNYQDAIVYTNKCIELYAEKARAMQSTLTDYPDGDTDYIHKNFWALNDVATSLFIKGKSLMFLEREQEARVVFKDLIENFTFGQCWDSQGPWFWKPAKAILDEFGPVASIGSE